MDILQVFDMFEQQVELDDLLLPVDESEESGNSSLMTESEDAAMTVKTDTSLQTESTVSVDEPACDLSVPQLLDNDLAHKCDTQFYTEPTSTDSIDQLDADSKKRKRSYKSANCPLCSRQFFRKYEMMRHLKATHLQMKPFSCFACPKTFARKSHLVLHWNNIHKSTLGPLLPM